MLLAMGARNGVAQTTPAPQNVVINEIQYAPSPSQNEFVELYNRSSTTVDLSTLSLADSREEPIALTSDSVLLPPGGYAVIVRDADLFAAAFPTVDFVAPAGWNALNNGGDAVILYAGSTVVDRVPYTPSWGGSNGSSLERIDPAAPSTSATNFGSSTAPDGATPGRQNSLYAPDVAPPAVRYAEVPAPDSVWILFDEPLANAISTDAFQLESGNTPVQIRHPEPNRLLLGFDRTVTGTQVRITGVADRVGNALQDTSVYLGYPPQPEDVAISEIMFAPRTDDFDGQPNQPEYVEIANQAPRALALRGLFWTDQPDETGAADTTRVGPVAMQVLPPAGRAVMYAEAAEDVTDPVRNGSLATAFPTIDFQQPMVVLLPIDAASLSFRNTGDRVRLQRAEDVLLDEVSYSPDWHASALADTRGVALERISLTGPSAAASNWTSSVAPGGGTPGQPNSVHLQPDAPSEDALTITPSPFSPDGDGFDDATRIRFDLTSDIASVRVRIYDARGRLVRTLEESRLVGRTGELIWDGRGHDGQTLRIGIYVVLFEALDTAGGRVVTMKQPVVLAQSLD